VRALQCGLSVFMQAAAAGVHGRSGFVNSGDIIMMMLRSSAESVTCVMCLKVSFVLSTERVAWLLCAQ
jgi:hypothetical protein